MRSSRLDSQRRHAGACLVAVALFVVAGCATAPDRRDQPPARDEVVSAVECARLGDELAQTEQARGVAAERSGNAWKAVVPVAVLALKASGTAAVHEADQRIAALKVRARLCAPSS